MVSIRPLLAATLCAACSNDTSSQADPTMPADTEQDLLAMFAAADVSDLRPSLEPDDGATLAADADAGKLIVDVQDDRKPVPDTSIAPFSQSTMLLVEFADGSLGLCSGTLIAPDAVLTAAHCIDNYDKGGVAARVLVVPGAYVDKNGRQQALTKVGTALSYPDDFNWPLEFDGSRPYARGNVPYDYAVLRLDRALGNAAGTRTLASSSVKQGSATTALAYHHDKCERADNVCTNARGYRQFRSTDTVRKLVGDWFEHGMDMTEGSSGAGISAANSAGAALFALNVAEDKARKVNVGLLLTPQRLATIRGWAGLQ